MAIVDEYIISAVYVRLIPPPQFYYVNVLSIRATLLIALKTISPTLESFFFFVSLWEKETHVGHMCIAAALINP